jgi:hypothetical protein
MLRVIITPMRFAYRFVYISMVFYRWEADGQIDAPDHKRSVWFGVFDLPRTVVSPGLIRSIIIVVQ